MASNADKVNQEVIDGIPGDVETHRNIYGDLERPNSIILPENPKRRQSYSAIWVVIACGFALMSDGSRWINLI
jgi:hypothetical protein